MIHTHPKLCPTLECRLTRNMVRQQKTAEYADSGKLAEYKKWMDPSVIEKHWKAREAVGLCVVFRMM